MYPRSLSNERSYFVVNAILSLVTSGGNLLIVFSNLSFVYHQ